MTIEVGPEDMVVTKNTDGDGRLYLGKDYEDKRVRAVVEVLGEKEQAPPDEPESDVKEEQDPDTSEDTENDSKAQDSEDMQNSEDSEESEGDSPKSLEEY